VWVPLDLFLGIGHLLVMRLRRVVSRRRHPAVVVSKFRVDSDFLPQLMEGVHGERVVVC
jgi:hypothetical protein